MLQNQKIKQFGAGQNTWTFVTKKNCRNQFKENYVFQVKPLMFNKIMKTNVLSLDIVKIMVVEAKDSVRCFKRNNYEHVQKHWQE